ncbi:late embryogenesis abundant protein At5g17165-like [Dioscorea cayenensis subsp. rotundata]|uniref:Late embryogenesis abundant protein At5g17165-like n=1 Tax=Dioscorea cayennensis subsp. rotundata TaxID=55577 RepID=A0AB40CTJ9_DIOCR|nr:late embryogenesis abundant protein At5g17165-like [Dioscorea cayenensis subsp. rotundata]
MAANSKGRAIASSLGKRFANRIWASTSRDQAPLPSSFALASRRGAHVSSYEKNYDDQVHPVVVPDDVIGSRSDKYWGPHPKTGVFGPSEQQLAAGDSASSATTSSGASSVLNETHWFRPLEDVDKPPHN